MRNPEQRKAQKFGVLLQRWRNAKHLTQATLAEQAGTSSRHLSFLENGKAQPSVEMVQRLADALMLSMSDANAFRVAAGYAPLYAERPLGAPELEHARQAIKFILKQQEPFPAIAVDGTWNVLMRNAASARIFSQFQRRALPGPHDNVMHAIFHPDGLRRFIVNWHEMAGAMIQTVHREEAERLHPGTEQLRRTLLAYPGVPEHWHTPDLTSFLPPLVTLKLKKDELELSFFSTITTFAKPRDLTLHQLRIECLHPATADTAEYARRLVKA